MLEPILKIHNKILRAIYFLGYRVEDKYKKAGILNVYELFIYELLKFLINSCRGVFVDDLNKIIEIRDNAYYETRSVVKRLTNAILNRTNINAIHFTIEQMYFTMSLEKLIFYR